MVTSTNVTQQVKIDTTTPNGYHDHKQNFPPLVSSFNDKIRPILDAVDKLRSLNITQEGIALPTIVVVGDQSSGKSSVLESLAGISLPRGQEICTRVPLIMRLQHHPDDVPEFVLEYKNETVNIVDESRISEAIEKATVEVAGNYKGIANVPLTLVVKKKGVPDLTMVDLPGITRVPIGDQPDDIYEQISEEDLYNWLCKKRIYTKLHNLSKTTLPQQRAGFNARYLLYSKRNPNCKSLLNKNSSSQPFGFCKNKGMIMEYIEPEESIILNVLPASVDFTTCESICMSRRVDSTGERTLAVVTKCDISPNGLLEKVTANDVNIGLGYTCVRNRINDETYDEARFQERQLFDTHPLLSKIDSSMVSIPVLASKLVQIQSGIISKCLPDIVKKIDERLNASISDLNKLPITLTTVPDAMVAFMQIVGSLKETLQRILIRGEFDQYEDDNQMHCNARLVEMLDEFSRELNTSIKFSEDFLVEEMKVLEEANGIRLPNFLPHSVFLCLLQRKVNTISDMPVSFVDKVWSYLETVCVRVVTDRCNNYPQLLPSMRKATLHVIREKKVQFEERVVEMLEMEKITDYTCDPEFTASYNKLMGHRSTFSSSMSYNHLTTTVEGYGSIDIRHLYDVAANTRNQAFDLKMRMTAYWNIVLKRMVDWVALQLRFMIQKVVNKEIEMEMNGVIVRGGGIEMMLDEPPSVAIKREKLQRSVGLLKASKEVIEQVMYGHN